VKTIVTWDLTQCGVLTAARKEAALLDDSASHIGNLAV
jgi:hypothetical protein